MTDLYKNKYRISSARMKNWDYGWNAPYFITICTKNRSHFFGEILHGEMTLSEIGKIASNEWIKTSEIRSDMNLLIDTFCIMPDHFHAIIIIGKNKYNQQDPYGTNAMPAITDAMPAIDGTDAMHRVSVYPTEITDAMPAIDGTDAMYRVSVYPTEITDTIPAIDGTEAMHRVSMNQFAPQSKNLASIIRGYKSSVTIQAKIINADFGWQPRFYDHIIRNHAELDRIRRYIIQNPKKWNNNKFL